MAEEVQGQLGDPPRIISEQYQTIVKKLVKHEVDGVDWTRRNVEPGTGDYGTEKDYTYDKTPARKIEDQEIEVFVSTQSMPPKFMGY